MILIFRIFFLCLLLYFWIWFQIKIWWSLAIKSSEEVSTIKWLKKIRLFFNWIKRIHRSRNIPYWLFFTTCIIKNITRRLDLFVNTEFFFMNNLNSNLRTHILLRINRLQRITSISETCKLWRHKLRSYFFSIFNLSFLWV